MKIVVVLVLVVVIVIESRTKDDNDDEHKNREWNKVDVTSATRDPMPNGAMKRRQRSARGRAAPGRRENAVAFARGERERRYAEREVPVGFGFFALALDHPTRMVSDGAKPNSCQFEYLRRVESGATEVCITDHGEPMAKIVSIPHVTALW